jgi:hypothetical protein
MTKAEKNHLLKWNTFCWLAAMILPGVLHLTLKSTKFPWPIILPFLLVGFMLASNRMLAQAVGKPSDE